MKILVLGGLTHLGFSALRMIHEVLPGIHVDAFDDTSYAATMFNTEQKVRFIKEMLPNCTLHADTPLTIQAVSEGGYTHLLDFSFQPKDTMGYIYPEYPHLEMLNAARRFENIVKTFPYINSCVVAHASLYTTLDSYWGIHDNKFNIRQGPSSPKAQPTFTLDARNRMYGNARIYMVPDCIGGVDPISSVYVSTMRCLTDNPLLPIRSTYESTAVHLVGTVDVLYTILNNLIKDVSSPIGGNVIFCKPVHKVAKAEVGEYIVFALNKILSVDTFKTFRDPASSEDFIRQNHVWVVSGDSEPALPANWGKVNDCDRILLVEGIHPSHYISEVVASIINIHRNTK